MHLKPVGTRGGSFDRGPRRHLVKLRVGRAVHVSRDGGGEVVGPAIAVVGRFVRGVEAVLLVAGNDVVGDLGARLPQRSSTVSPTSANNLTASGSQRLVWLLEGQLCLCAVGGRTSRNGGGSHLSAGLDPRRNASAVALGNQRHDCG